MKHANPSCSTVHSSVDQNFPFRGGKKLSSPRVKMSSSSDNSSEGTTVNILLLQPIKKLKPNAFLREEKDAQGKVQIELGLAFEFLSVGIACIAVKAVFTDKTVPLASVVLAA